jgi:hypothetical protein
MKVPSKHGNPHRHRDRTGNDQHGGTMLVNLDPDFERLLDPLTPEEFAQLEENILREGCRDSLRLWNTYLIDGHNRYRICKKHSLPFGTTPIELPDKDAALLWIEENQLGRRNLTDEQRVARVASIYEKREKRKAGRPTNEMVSQTDTITEARKGKTRDKVAKEFNVSPAKLRDMVTVQKAAPEVAAEVRAGKLTVAQAKRKVKTEADPSSCQAGTKSSLRDDRYLVDKVQAIREAYRKKMAEIMPNLSELTQRQMFLFQAVQLNRERHSDGDPANLLYEHLLEFQTFPLVDGRWPEIDALADEYYSGGDGLTEMLDEMLDEMLPREVTQ